ncbi:aspartate aminotransferase family protein [Bacillus aquiflavi]|uniref:glutamate-1-semialdehyde 2,1-aminomutase n=1 Tax=Bacillus aquiflavi TaxID=2672567 RepID=A0A6B3W4Q8_9BACI|nr:aspartate aminotransferase family protein [Bacillus aquiflavi]MBA4538563.1 aspartate aminotransferase family protein [Bacillus aquiflavi]NEY82926.1 aspartate aminotransferase family protein [Bacillus aquiflavi]
MKRSAKIYEEARTVIPGGVAANIKYFAPHPIVMEKGNGSRLWDVDGNEYVDYLLCYGALILGHGHPEVNHAVFEQLTSFGTAVFGTPHHLEVEMAKQLVKIFPGIEMVRYTNSGLEATLLSIRLAQAYTEKTKIAKFEGHYHGGYDQVLLSVNPNINDAGQANKPKTVPDSKGIPQYYVENTIILPFNDMEATEKLLRRHADELAAVILEPVQGGFIPAEKEFIELVRKLTSELGILLIFDEVKTGFRLSVGGAQSLYKITPDITALGKVLGGGFPVGAVGGKCDIMEMMAPDRGRDILIAEVNAEQKEDPVFHSGTYNGHPTVMAAGLATIKVLASSGVMEQLLKFTNLLRTNLEAVYHKNGITMKTIGMGSIFNIVLTDKSIKNYRDLKTANMLLRKEIDYELLKLGVYTKPLNRYSMSVAHSKADIDFTVAAHEQAIKRVKERGIRYG